MKPRIKSECEKINQQIHYNMKAVKLRELKINELKLKPFKVYIGMSSLFKHTLKVRQSLNTLTKRN